MSRMVQELDRANSSGPSLADPASPIEISILYAMVKLADSIAKRELPRLAEKAIENALCECQKECEETAREILQDFLQNPAYAFSFKSDYRFLSDANRKQIKESIRLELKELVASEVKAAVAGSDLEDIVRTAAQVTVAGDVQKAARAEVKRLVDRVTNDMLNAVPSRPDEEVGQRRVIT